MTCSICHRPILCSRWEVSVSSRVVINDKPIIRHEHLRCALEIERRPAEEIEAEAKEAGIV